MGIGIYNLHGLGISIRADNEDLLEALHARLGRLSVGGSVDPVIFFTFTQGAPPLPPKGPSRPVYDPPEGQVLYYPRADALWIDYGGKAWVCCWAGEGKIEVHYKTPSPLLVWLLSHPLFSLPLIEALRRRGLYNIHAAGLVSGGRALLFAGSSGAGKSTLTLAMLQAGLGLLGDDTVFVRGEEILAFPDEIDVTEETADWFGSAFPALRRPNTEGFPKKRLSLEEAGACWVNSALPGLLVFPEVARQPTSELTSLAAEEALLALASNVLLTNPDVCRQHLELLARLVQHVPAYRLKTGYDLKDLARQLHSLLEEAPYAQP